MDRTTERSTRSSRSQSTSSHVSSTSSSHSYADAPSPALTHSPHPFLDSSSQDQDVAMAIAALGLMRSGSSSGTNGPSLDGPRPNRSSHAHRTASRAPSIASTASRSAPGLSSSTGTSSPVGPASLAPGSEAGDGEGSEYGDGEGDPRFIARVSQLPLVSGGLEWYERSKASSRVVKYGAGLVESSLSAVSRPLANNLQLGQLDDFACRQLDRLGGGGGVLADAREAAARRAYDEEERGREEELEERGRQGVRDPSATAEVGVRTESQNQQAVAVASRSRWQTVLVEAGGLGAAVSEESLKSLRYCLQWLLYATAHLDHQITVLRDFILSLRRHPTSDARSDALVTASASAHLVQIKHDVVETIRKVVEVVSKYAGVALPEQAKRYVRQSILGLPVKWASAIEGGRDGRGASVGTTSSASTPTAERMEEPSRYGDGPREQDEGRDGGEGGEGAGNPALRPTEDAAERVLTFAVESLDMLRSVTSIFGDSVEKAEAWIERLRIVGLDRQRQRRAAEGSMSPPPPPDDQLATGMKRRRTAGDGSASGVELAGTDGEDGVARRKRAPRSHESTANAGLAMES